TSGSLYRNRLRKQPALAYLRPAEAETSTPRGRGGPTPALGGRGRRGAQPGRGGLPGGGQARATPPVRLNQCAARRDNAFIHRTV
ncbi:hypothetical protein AUM95_07605, partial [Cronobacter sakazakii]